MLYRFAMIGVVGFWLVMMGMLVRLETHPETTDILDVPISYVARIMFNHGQHSLLAVREEGKPIGFVSLHPSVTGSNGRALDFSGALSMQLPLAARQHYNFSGTVDMDGTLRVLDFHVNLTIQETHCRLAVTGDSARKTLACEVTQGGQRIFSQTLPMDAAALGPALLQNMGMDANMFNALPISAGGISLPSVTAREAQITLHGEKLEVYQVTVREGTAELADFYMTQLGQVVLAKTNFGYTLATEDVQ
jgi:hypothetical protein